MIKTTLPYIAACIILIQLGCLIEDVLGENQTQYELMQRQIDTLEIERYTQENIYTRKLNNLPNGVEVRGLLVSIDSTEIEYRIKLNALKKQYGYDN